MARLKPQRYISGFDASDSSGLVAVNLNNTQVFTDLAYKDLTLSWVMQESRETLFRLQRMAGFESQNFDPQVALLCTCITLQRPRLQVC